MTDFAQRQPHPDLPPPASEVGVVGWLRKNLFSSPMNTVLNQTGQAVEVIAITMSVYLVISLVISAFMNWYNRHIALVER